MLKSHTTVLSQLKGPQVSVSPEEVRSLFFDTAVMKKLAAVVEVNGASANAIVDGDPNTLRTTADRLFKSGYDAIP